MINERTKIIMKQIESYEELSKMIFSHLKKNVLTNAFQSKEAWLREIEEKNLFYEQAEEYLLLFRDRKKFYILNYYINNPYSEMLKKAINTPKMLVTEVVSKDEGSEAYNTQLKMWNSLGFICKLKRERFQKNVYEKTLNGENRLENLRISKMAGTLETIVLSEETNTEKIPNVSKKTEKEMILKISKATDEIKALEFLNANFSQTTGCIPTLKQMELDIEKGNVIQAKMAEKIVGILHFDIQNKSSEIKHLAVDKEYRNNGIASQLLTEYEKIAKDKLHIVWTGADNHEAKRLYQKNGYRKDGYVSSVYEFNIL